MPASTCCWRSRSTWTTPAPRRWSMASRAWAATFGVVFQHRFREASIALRERLHGGALGVPAVGLGVRAVVALLRVLRRARPRQHGPRRGRRAADAGHPHPRPRARPRGTGGARDGAVPDEPAAQDRHRGHRLRHGRVRERCGRRDRRDDRRLPRLSRAHRPRGHEGQRGHRGRAPGHAVPRGARPSPSKGRWPGAAVPTRWRSRTPPTHA